MCSRMKYKYIITHIVAIVIALISGLRSETLASDPSDRSWRTGFSIVYTSRTLNGTIVNKSQVSDDAFGDLVTTGDSMNVGSSDTFMLALTAKYHQWNMGINYLPTSFSGEGSALVGLSGDQAGVWAKTPLRTDIDIDMLLGSVGYSVINTPQMEFGVGVGLGQTAIDLSILPDIGDPIVYQGYQPFGYLSMYMSNTYKKFLYGFNLNGISATFDGVYVNYSDYKVYLGYRIFNKMIKGDVVGGYRTVNFAIDIEYAQNIVAADANLDGPFLGINISY